jgi:predicted AlkP superfamily pyrophosphatase or phosphodiesterase
VYSMPAAQQDAALGEMDRHLARLLSALEAKVGADYLLAVTADHGMPPEPSSSDPTGRPAGNFGW